MTANTRMLQTAQRGLPLVMCTLGVLELGAVVVDLGERSDQGGFLTGVGLGAFAPITMAVVFATLLRASADTLLVKATTAVAAGIFAVIRVAFVVASVTSGADLGVGELLTVVSGTAFGLALAVWSAVENRAAHLLVAERRRDREDDAGDLADPETVPSPTRVPAASHTRPHVPAPAHDISAPVSAPTPTTVIRPAAPRAVRQASSVTQVSPTSAAASLWHRGSTPWPRKNEDDPDGTLLRPPQRR